MSKDDNLLIRCPVCGRENYAPNVATGICTWCNYKKGEGVGKKKG
jgi:ribosomal protein L37E